MHEYSLARALHAQVEKLSQGFGAARVVGIAVGVGELAGVEPEFLRSAFELLCAREGSRLPRLELHPIPLEVRCLACGLEFRVRAHRFVCPACGGGGLTVLRGEELILEQVSLETDEECHEPARAGGNPAGPSLP